MNTTLKQIQKLIDTLESTAELNTVGRILKARHNTIQCLTGMSFRPGQQVVFISKSGRSINGTISKINTKSIDIDCHGYSAGRWRVSPSMVKAA